MVEKTFCHIAIKCSFMLISGTTVQPISSFFKAKTKHPVVVLNPCKEGGCKRVGCNPPYGFSSAIALKKLKKVT